jgi:hypothetical protein
MSKEVSPIWKQGRRHAVIKGIKIRLSLSSSYLPGFQLLLATCCLSMPFACARGNNTRYVNVLNSTPRQPPGLTSPSSYHSLVSPVLDQAGVRPEKILI